MGTTARSIGCPERVRNSGGTRSCATRTRDREVAVALGDAGWRRATVWECALRGPQRLDFEILIDRLCDWLRSGPERHGTARHPLCRVATPRHRFRLFPARTGVRVKYGQLRDHFRGVAVKRLSGVDAEPSLSNQHEIGATQAMRQAFLGEGPRRDFPAVYIWLGQDQDAITVQSRATYYDAREHQPHRAPEWRLYYPSNPVTEKMREGDALFLALDTAGTLYFIIAPAHSTSEDQLAWLFGVAPQNEFAVLGFVDEGPELDFAAHFILDELGIEFEDPDAPGLDTIIEPLGNSFPPTAVFSKLARDSLQDVSPLDDPDAALLAWVSHEEALFRRLERRNRRRTAADRLCRPGRRRRRWLPQLFAERAESQEVPDGTLAGAPSGSRVHRSPGPLRSRCRHRERPEARLPLPEPQRPMRPRRWRFAWSFLCSAPSPPARTGGGRSSPKPRRSRTSIS